MSASQVLRIVVGTLCAIIGLSLLLGGAVLLWAQLGLRDGDGYFTSSQYRLSSAGSAVTLDSGEVGPGLPALGAARATPVTIRLRVSEGGSGPVFVGIGRQDQVTAYLQGVPHNQVVDLDERGGQVATRPVGGSATPAPPGEQTFWVTSAAGSGTQTLTWPVQQGSWTLVVMNVSGAAGVDVQASAGAQVGYLTEIALGLLVGGGLVLLGGAVAVFAGHGPGAARDGPAAGEPGTEDRRYPLTLEASFDLATSRWMWLVKWFLAIPHLVALAFLWFAFVLLTVLAGLAILFTGRYPRPVFDMNLGILRWTWRVGAYAFLLLNTDRYPPFTWNPADYPAALEIEYPERLSRWLVLVKWWLLAIPQLLIVAILIGSAGTFGLRGPWGVPLIVAGGLIGLLVLIAGVHLAVLHRYPAELFGLLVGLNRWVFRVLVYVALMTDDYPPFRLDQGGTERPAGRREPAAAETAT